MDANGNNSMRKARWPIQILLFPLTFPGANKNTQSQTRAERAFHLVERALRRTLVGWTNTERQPPEGATTAVAAPSFPLC